MIENKDEKSFTKDSYWMQNKTETRWMFYHKKMPIIDNENFIIEAEIELLSHRGYGQYGLVWDFDKPHQVLNKFAVSVNNKRFSVTKFEKDYHRNFHRFAGKYEKEPD